MLLSSLLFPSKKELRRRRCPFLRAPSVRIMTTSAVLLRLLLLLLAFASCAPVVRGCNRFYTSTAGGKVLTRLNRRNGLTKDVGKWTNNGGGDRIIDTMEWNFKGERMYGFELDESKPTRSQRFVRINRQKPRGANINNVTLGLTNMFDLKGLAVDGNDTYFAHSVENRTLYSVDESTGALTPLFVTGIPNVLDLAYKIDTDEIWAVNGTNVYVINHNTGTVSEFVQTFVQRNPNNRIVAIGFNPVKHVPIVLTQGEAPEDASVVPPAVYRFIKQNGTEVFQGATTITAVPPRGGTIQCKRRVFSPSPSAMPSSPTTSPVALPTKVSAAPSTFPTTVRILTLDLIPFSITVDSEEAVNTTALELTLEAYFLDLFQQQSSNVQAVDLVQVDNLQSGSVLFGGRRRLRLGDETSNSHGLLRLGQQRRRQLQGVQVVYFTIAISFQTASNVEEAILQAIEIAALVNQTALQAQVTANPDLGEFVVVLSVSLSEASSVPSSPPSGSAPPSLLPSEVPSSSAPSTAPSTDVPETTAAPIAATTSAPVAVPITPAPILPATAAPVSAAPVSPAPLTPAPVTIAPVSPSPVTPSPATDAPATPTPVTPAPVTLAPVTPAPVTDPPVTDPQATDAPATPAPITPAPITPAPITPAPITPAPITPAPITSAPITPAPTSSQHPTASEFPTMTQLPTSSGAPSPSV